MDLPALTHVLTRPRLKLPPVICGDRDLLLAHWGGPEVRRFLFDGAPAVPEQIA